MIFRYFLSDTVPREDIYLGNRAIIDNIDELWTFGPLSDGVLAEVSLAKKRGHKVKHYKIVQDKPSVRFRKVPAQFVELEEPELEKYRGILLDEIHNK